MSNTRLVTLGGLRLEPNGFRRPKSLLLLAYLSLEHGRSRDHLRSLFWQNATDASASLRVALAQLRQGVPGSLEETDSLLLAKIPCDVVDLQAALDASDWERAVKMYTGAFLDGLMLSELGSELEEWVLTTREFMADQMRKVYLRLGEEEANRGQFETATRYAETAYTLRGASELEPAEIPQLYRLFLVGQSFHATKLRSEAQELGLLLEETQTEARARFQRTLLGREEELEQLRSLQAGEWAWISGGPSMGKSSLLKALFGQYIPARTGLPYATLQPLLGDSIITDDRVAFEKLSRLNGTLLLDGWSQMDSESQILLKKLRGIRPPLRVFITSRTDAVIETELRIELQPLTEAVLEPYPGIWEVTGGLPSLVEACLKGEPLEIALDKRLSTLTSIAREVSLAIALLDEPNLPLLRRALNLIPEAIAEAIGELQTVGFVESSGRLRVRQAILDYLDNHETIAAPLALKLARQQQSTSVFHLYQRSRAFWGSEDLPHVQQSYLTSARELSRLGFTLRAAKVLQDAPPSLEIILFKAKNLERSGRYLEAEKALEGIPDNHGVLALKAALLWRSGKLDEARHVATIALTGDMEARAEAHDVLGCIALSEANPIEALDHCGRAAALFLALGEHTCWGQSLNNVASARSQLGEDVESAYEEALKAASTSPILRIRVHTNLGREYELKKEFAKAERALHQALLAAKEMGIFEGTSRIQNNLGVIYEKMGRKTEAHEAYKKAIETARSEHDPLLVAMALANLGELIHDIRMLEEALELMKTTGDLFMINRYKNRLQNLVNVDIQERKAV